MKLFFRILILFATGAILSGRAADLGDTQELAARSGIEQQSIRSDAMLMRGKITAIREELMQNGAAPEDVAPLDQALSKLESLTETQMINIIMSLQSAGLADQTSVRNALLAAYRGQKEAQREIASLVENLQLRNSLRELHASVRKILLDQVVNHRSTVSLQAGTSESAEARRVRANIVTTRQTAIEQEANHLIDGMRREVLRDDNPEKQALEACIAAVTKSNLGAFVQQAARNTSAGNWEQAAVAQVQVREALEEVLRTFQGVANPSENLQNALRVLEEIRENQKMLCDYTWKERTPDSLAEQRSGQASILDIASVLQKLLAGLREDATLHMGEARTKMQASLDSLVLNNSDGSAGRHQELALGALAKVEESLKQQSAALTLEDPALTANSSAFVVTTLNAALSSAETALQTIDAAKPADAAGEFSKAGKLLNGLSAIPMTIEAQKSLQQAQAALEAAAQSAIADKAAEARASGAAGQEAIAQAKASLEGTSASPAGGQSSSSNTPGAMGGMPGGDQETGLMGSNGPDAAAGSALITGALKPKDREAIRQLAREKVPEEYIPLVQQYMKSLADEDGTP